MGAMFRYISEDGHARNSRDRFFEQLQVLCHDLCAGIVGQSGDVTARSGEVGDQPTTHGVNHPIHDDRDGAGGFLGCPDIRSGMNQEEVDLQIDQLRRERRSALLLPFRIPTFDDKILARHVPVFPQSLRQCLSV